MRLLFINSSIDSCFARDSHLSLFRPRATLQLCNVLHLACFLSEFSHGRVRDCQRLGLRRRRQFGTETHSCALSFHVPHECDELWVPAGGAVRGRELRAHIHPHSNPLVHARARASLMLSPLLPFPIDECDELWVPAGGAVRGRELRAQRVCGGGQLDEDPGLLRHGTV